MSYQNDLRTDDGGLWYDLLHYAGPKAIAFFEETAPEAKRFDHEGKDNAAEWLVDLTTKVAQTPCLYYADRGHDMFSMEANGDTLL